MSKAATRSMICSSSPDSVTPNLHPLRHLVVGDGHRSTRDRPGSCRQTAKLILVL
jgi:hypothetical protein